MIKMYGDYYTPKEVAETFKVHSRTILRLIEDGELEALRIGHQWRIPAAAVEKMLAKSRGKEAKK